MLQVTLSHELPGDPHGPREHTLRLTRDSGSDPIAVPREILEAILTPQERDRLPPAMTIFTMRVSGPDLYAWGGSERMEFKVDGKLSSAKATCPLRDRGTISINGILFTYAVKYV